MGLLAPLLSPNWSSDEMRPRENSEEIMRCINSVGVNANGFLEIYDIGDATVCFVKALGAVKF